MEQEKGLESLELGRMLRDEGQVSVHLYMTFEPTTGRNVLRAHKLGTDELRTLPKAVWRYVEWETAELLEDEGWVVMTEITQEEWESGMV